MWPFVAWRIVGLFKKIMYYLAGLMTLRDEITDRLALLVADYLALLVTVVAVIFVVMMMLDLYANYIGYSGTSSSPI